MLGYVLIGFLLGGSLGYALFYFRYSDTRNIDNLRVRYKESRDEYENVQHDLEELNAQNGILKEKTKRLIQQNEDYSKLISELSRYYFHIKEATQKVDELGNLLRIYDGNLDRKLLGVGVDVPTLGRSKGIIPIDSSQKQTGEVSSMNETQKFF